MNNFLEENRDEIDYILDKNNISINNIDSLQGVSLIMGLPLSIFMAITFFQNIYFLAGCSFFTVVSIFMIGNNYKKKKINNYNEKTIKFLTENEKEIKFKIRAILDSKKLTISQEKALVDFYENYNCEYLSSALKIIKENEEVESVNKRRDSILKENRKVAYY